MSKFCSNCGSKLKDEDAFCGACGEKTKEVKEESKVYEGEVVNENGGSNVNPPKSKIAAGLLGIFLGAFGVHNFYLGYTGKAIAQLLLTVLSCGIFSPATYIWGLIEGILVLTGSINVDAEGNPLGE